MDFYNLDDEKSEVAIRYYRERYTDIGIFENRCFDGALEVLERLKNQGKTLALATSKPTVFACRICDKYNMTQYLDAICGSEIGRAHV